MEVLMFVLFLMLMLGESFFFIRVLHLPAHLAPLTVLLFDTLILFVFAELGMLSVAYYFVILLGIGLSLFALVRLFVKSDRKANLLPIVAFILVMAVAFFYTRGTLFYDAVEFSQWGVLYRYLMTTNALPQDLNVVSGVYQPLAALWQYFVSQIIGFDEGNAYFAHILIQFAALIAIFPVKKWSDWAKYLLTLCAATLSIFVFDFQFQNLQVDLLMALLVGAGFSLSFNDEISTISRFITVSLIAAALALTQSLGIVLALVVAVLNIAAIFRSNTQMMAAKRGFVRALRSILDLKIVLLLVLPLAAWMSWHQYSQKIDLNRIVLQTGTTEVSAAEVTPSDTRAFLRDLKAQEDEMRLSMGILQQPRVTAVGSADILRMFSVDAPYRTRAIANAYVNSFSNTSIGKSKITLKMAGIAILILIVLNAFILWTRSRKFEKRMLVINAFMLLGFAVYGTALFIAYVLFYPPYTALTVPSIANFLGGYLLAWWLANLCIASQSMMESPANSMTVQASYLMVGITAALALFLPTSNYLHLPVSPANARFDAETLAASIRQAGLQPSDKVYEVYGVTPDLNGVEHDMLRYFLTPSGSNSSLWDFTNRETAKSPYVVKITPEQWFLILQYQHYTYVLVTASDAEFWQTYGSLFDTHTADFSEPQLFSVTETNLEFIPLVNTGG